MDTPIPAVTVEFQGLEDLVMTKGEWDELGGYVGFMRSYCISIRDIKKVHYHLLKPSEFPTREWMS